MPFSREEELETISGHTKLNIGAAKTNTFWSIEVVTLPGLQHPKVTVSGPPNDVYAAKIVPGEDGSVNITLPEDFRKPLRSTPARVDPEGLSRGGGAKFYGPLHVSGNARFVGGDVHNYSDGRTETTGSVVSGGQQPVGSSDGPDPCRIQVYLPAGSTIETNTGSDVKVNGDFDEISIANASGTVDVEGSFKKATIKVAGDIKIQRVVPGAEIDVQSYFGRATLGSVQGHGQVIAYDPVNVGFADPDENLMLHSASDGVTYGFANSQAKARVTATPKNRAVGIPAQFSSAFNQATVPGANQNPTFGWGK